MGSLVWTVGGAMGLGIVGALGMATTTLAQNDIVPDDTLGVDSSTVVPLNATIDAIVGGAVREQNLFHSFETFSIGDGNGAYFITTLDDINNIFARVTGNDESTIFGVLGTAQLTNTGFIQSGADLYLINPNGIIFGENSSLDVGASFTATTADIIQFGTEDFRASNPNSPALGLTINPSAYLFTQPLPANILSVSTRGNGLRGLRVPNGRNLTFLAGDIEISGLTNLVGTGLQAPGGRVELVAMGGAGAISIGTDNNLFFPDTTPNGRVRLADQAQVDVSLDDGGDISIIAGDITLTNGSILNAGIASGLGGEGSQAGNIVLNANDRVVFDGLSGALNTVAPGGMGNSGNIEITTNTLDLLNIGILSSSTAGKGNAGNVIINAADRVVLDGFSAVLSSVASGGVGRGGNVDITTNTLDVLNTSRLLSSTLGEGNAGNVIIKAADRVVLDGSGLVTSRVVSGGMGNGGNVDITTNTLDVLNNSSLSSDTSGEGNAGNVIITASDRVVFDGASLAFSSVLPGGVGDGGNVDIITNTLDVLSESELSSGTSGEGDAGNVIIKAADRVIFDDLSSASSSVLAGGVGSGGNVKITANTLEILNTSSLLSNTFGKGDAGHVIINADESVVFDQASLAFSSVESGGVGSGGNVDITTNTLDVLNGSVFSSRILGEGNAGNVIVNVAGQLLMLDGEIEALSVASSGGEITIDVSSAILRGDSDIITSVINGSGKGGDITITGNFIIALNDSDILASATDGRGGNIVLNVGGFFGENFTFNSLAADPETLDGNARVDINATGAVNGVVILPDISFIENSLTDLPDTIVSPDQILRTSCISRTDQNQGTFTITGSGGLPTRPNGDVLSTYPTGQPTTATTTTATTAPWQLGEPINEATVIYELTDGRLVLSQDCHHSPTGNDGSPGGA